MQTDINSLLPSMFAFGAFLAAALLFAALSGTPNSGLLVLPDVPMLGIA